MRRDNIKAGTEANRPKPSIYKIGVKAAAVSPAKTWIDFFVRYKNFTFTHMEKFVVI
jgi:hypothetical protein